jgi:hypothetical protein
MDYENRVTLCGALSAATKKVLADRSLAEELSGDELLEVVYDLLDIVSTPEGNRWGLAGHSTVLLGWHDEDPRERGQVDDECECGAGWLLGQGYADAPPGWVSVQRCDTCRRYEYDEDAARAAAESLGGVPVEFFQESPDEDCDDPGDWGILPGGIHQVCERCGFDIEAHGPAWIDRGGVSGCPDGKFDHAPAEWRWRS